MRALLETLLDLSGVALTKPSDYLNRVRPRFGVTLRDGSWGPEPAHRAWNSFAAQRLWRAIGEVEERVALLVQRHPHAQGDNERVLAQAVRELLLAQSSDWPQQLSQGAGDDALQRPIMHLRRCERLCALVHTTAWSDDDMAFLDALEEADNAFPNLNYRVFSNS